MAFNKIDKSAALFPPRQWALVGRPNSGKSTFAAQMAGPLLVIDSDHRFQEVARLAAGDVYEVSDNPADHVDAERIAALLKENMASSDIKTVIIDSLTSILTPLVVEAILDNDAGRNKNRVASFKNKALAMRLLQDSTTNTGCHTLWIYHLRSGLDGQAREVESTTISAVELARLRRSLNMQLRIVEEGERRGIRVDWARCGRAGVVLWDESGAWADMPARIERAVYGGLSAADMDRLEHRAPTQFCGPEDAIAWGVGQGCFRDAVHAKNAYDKCKRAAQPATAQAMWHAWVADVQQRVQAATVKPSSPAEHETLAAAGSQAEDADNPFIDTPKAKPDKSPSFRRFQVEGGKTFGADWDNARHWLIERYTLKMTPTQVRQSANDLSDDELDVLADVLTEKRSYYQKEWCHQGAG